MKAFRSRGRDLRFIVRGFIDGISLVGLRFCFRVLGFFFERLFPSCRNPEHLVQGLGLRGCGFGACCVGKCIHFGFGLSGTVFCNSLRHREPRPV